MSISPNMTEVAAQPGMTARPDSTLGTTPNVVDALGQHVSLGPGGIPENFNNFVPNSLDFQTGKVLADDFLSPDLDNIQTTNAEKVIPSENYLPNELTDCLSTYEERIAQTPTEGLSANWTGERGESTYIPNDPKLKDLLAQYGKTGVDYVNGMPDFSPFTKTEVKIENMSSDRYSNFSQADKLCSAKWNEMAMDNKTDWTPRDIADFRSNNGFTWHECNDRETCQLVPSAINDKPFSHLGGVSECKHYEQLNDNYDLFDPLDVGSWF